MARRDVVLLGESHVEADHHRWQLHTLAQLQAQRPQMVIGFETFPRRAQPVLDKWVAGELTEQQFLAEVEWDEVWNTPSELYMPLFEFARLHRVPMVALNVDKKLTEAVAAKGWDAVPEREREGLTRPAPAPKAYLEELEHVYRMHKESGGKATLKNFIEAQQTWDRAMAQGLARQAGRGALVVGIIGSGHLRFGYGVALQLRDLGVTRVGTLLPVGRAQCKELVAGIADAAFIIPERPAVKPPPPRLGVQLEQEGANVRLLEVIAGSLAERTGLRKGDVIVAAAGKPLARMGDLVRTVRSAPDGTWLPLQVRRGAETQEILVKFPPAK
ncbi:MAG: PDZ domain-containing protein [Betaproteobacteria bacterium]|nr:MAG: PDZ domain-containing protein [Betaproteobacteria bacterium]